MSAHALRRLNTSTFVALAGYLKAGPLLNRQVPDRIVVGVDASGVLNTGEGETLIVLCHHPDALIVLGRVLRPEAPGQDIEPCPKEQRLSRGLLLEPCDDALQPVPVDGSLFGLHAEEVEGGDCTQIGACCRRVNSLGRWV